MLILVFLIFAVATPASAQNVAGWFQLRRPSGMATDRITVQGWAISRCGSPEVILAVDQHELARAHPWLEWPGVPERFPGVASAHSPGFETVLDPLHFQPGQHRVEIRASSPECREIRSLGEASFVSSEPPRWWIAWALLVLAASAIALLGFALQRKGFRYHRVPIWFVIPALQLMMIGAILLVPRLRGVAGTNVFAPLASWDGGWYLLIARQGYATIGNAAYAFFPLYPLLLKALSTLPFPIEMSASFVNAVLFAGSIRLMQKLMPEQESGLLAFAALPFSFFFVAVYTESLALFLSVVFLRMLREQRPLPAFASGFLAGLTRVTSLALVLLAIDELRVGRRKSLIASLGPAAGVATYMTYLGFTTGDPFRFMRAQEHFGRATSFSAGRLVQVLNRAVMTNHRWELVAICFLALVMTGAAILILKGRVGEGVYSAVLVSLPLATLTLTSLHRYALLAFPVFPVIGGLLRNRVAYSIVIVLEIALLFLYASHFGQGHWVG